LSRAELHHLTTKRRDLPAPGIILPSRVGCRSAALE